MVFRNLHSYCLFGNRGSCLDNFFHDLGCRFGNGFRRRLRLLADQLLNELRDRFHVAVFGHPGQDLAQGFLHTLTPFNRFLMRSPYSVPASLWLAGYGRL